MPNCTVEPVDLGRVGRRVIEAAFDGGDIVSDGGVLLLRQVDQRIGLTKSIARVFDDQRRRASVAHSMRDLLAQRI
ncbi:transposase, partial [Pseudoduganella namucuonensis]